MLIIYLVVKNVPFFVTLRKIIVFLDVIDYNKCKRNTERERNAW
jgi:hypothetical protein